LIIKWEKYDMEKKKKSGIFYLFEKSPQRDAKFTLIFIHGAGGTSIMWKEQVTGLSKIADTIALDLPGHGDSEGDGMDSIGNYAKIIMSLLKNLNIENPIPVGLSMGGAIVQKLLLEYPENFKAGVLSSTGAKLKVMPAIFETIINNFDAYVDMIGKFSISPKTDPQIMQPIQEDTKNINPDTVTGDFNACNNFDVRDKLAEIQMPVLIISAEHDQLTPPKYSDYLEENIKNSVRISIKEAGHMVPVEKPEEFNKAIVDFLSGIDKQ
jgi:pimeloyl-ACP methyl ester carboxylesterase